VEQQPGSARSTKWANNNVRRGDVIMKPIMLGKITVRKVPEIETSLPMDAIFPGVTARDLAQLKNWYWDDALSLAPADAQCGMSMHTYLVQFDGKTILIDSCNGNDKDRSMAFGHRLRTPWLDRLRELGVEPEDVDMVMCTHLHIDHVGWNTRLEGGRWVPTFPNARYVMGKRDVDHVSSPETDAFNREPWLDSILPVIEAGQADIVEEDKVILGKIGNGLWLRPAYGHSPGCCMIHARREGPSALFSGDVIHHPIQLIRPDLHFAYDWNGALAAQVRTTLLNEIAGTDTVLFPAHFRQGSAGHVERDVDVFRYRFVAG
jgi:glyoxylase-like metal-dependent hydrolase (beta-lactamase superfamily II)